MANNFFLTQDPLLYQNPYSNQFQPAPADDGQLRQQLNDAYMRYRDAQEKVMSQPVVNDYIGDLDKAMKNLSEEATAVLENNEEYLSLSNKLQGIVQAEIMSAIKWKINSNPSAVKIIQRQQELVDNVVRQVQEEEKRNMNELNDYVKNYSSMTFDEYKQTKAKIRKNNSKKKDVSDDNQ